MAEKSEVTALLDRLAAGEVTVEEVAENFAARTWPASRPAATSYEEAARREWQDPEPAPTGSWEEVEAAYACGQISIEDYRVLFQARADAASRK